MDWSLKSFNLKTKSSEREMAVNKKKVTKKIREEENASGIAVNDLTEKEALIEELVPEKTS